MKSMIRLLSKVNKIIIHRVRTQGIKVTLVWFYGRGLPLITGVPLFQFSEITPEIYIGPQYNKLGKRKLEDRGIHYDVNMRIEFDDAEHGLALDNYCYLPTIDDDPPTFEHLDQGVKFIREGVAAGGKVYIHCAGGIGRAPSMALAYFIRQGMSLTEAMQLIEQTRPFIDVKPEQMEQLRRYEASYQQSLNGQAA